MQSASSLSNQDKFNLRTTFKDLKIDENIKGNKYENSNDYRFNFKTLPNTVLGIRNYYELKNAQAINYFASLPVFTNEQTTILHVYADNKEAIYGFRPRFGYAKILLQETYNAKYGNSPLVHLVDIYGQTALHHACKSFHSINDPDVLNRSLIHQCAMIGMLLAYGADPTSKDNNSKTPFDLLQEALNKIDPPILAKLDSNAFTFQALSSAYQNELNYEKQGWYEKVGEEEAKKIAKEDLDIDIELNFPPSPHLNLPKHGQVSEQYMNPEHLENITRWQDKVKEVVVPQVSMIPSSNSAGCSSGRCVIS